MEKGLISVVIPTYNREKTIIRAVESVLNQTYSAIEVCIVDDCSSDQTDKVIQEIFGNDSRVHFTRLEKNSGACVARNVGIDISNGEYIAFLDSDDQFLPHKLECQLKAMHKSSCSMCVSDYYRTHEDGTRTVIKAYDGNKDEMYQQLLYCNFITTGTLIAHRNCLQDCRFDETLPRYQDWDLALRMVQKYDICVISEPLLDQEHQTVSITSSTSHAKTLFALDVIYGKHIESYSKNARANAQVHWLMGLHSVCTDKPTRWKDLWIGATAYKFNIKRVGIYMLAKMGNRSIIEGAI